MSRNGNAPLDGIASCLDVPDHREPVEPYFGPELRRGEILDDRFVIGEPLNRSGMATIFEARDKHDHDRVVAVKVPHLRYESDPNFYSRFQREEAIGRKLDHPYLLKFLPVEGRKSRPYLVTEYLRGCTLHHLMSVIQPLPEKDALRIASLLCEAVQHMHANGVIHRDLKPGNVMICLDRTIRLMDFGIASSTDSRRVTVSGLTPAMGTPEYMAPEQVQNKASDARTDVYGLGAILYEMLTGRLPFENDNPWLAMNNRVTGDPIAPRKLNPAISPQAEEIVLHAMRRNPDDRYPTVAAMKIDLDAPAAVQVTGFCDRLRKPHWRLGFRGETPVLAGTLIALGFIACQALLFLLLRYFLARH